MTVELNPGANPERRGITQRYRDARKVTLVGGLIDLGLTVAKIVVGLVGNSWALVADGIHSFSDLVTDGLVLFGAAQGARGPDASHPYGHGKIETMVVLLSGLALIGTAMGILLAGAERLQGSVATESPSLAVIWVAVVAILVKEALYHYTVAVAKKQNSKLLKANAWNHRSDSVSGLIVLAGVLGSRFGFPYFDPLAAIVVAVMIGRIGWDLLRHANRDLTDVALDEQTQKKIRQVILGVSGVVGLHMLRTRYIGPYALVDVHAMVEPRISVSEGHRIAEKIRDRVIWQLDEVTDVLVHIDSENDEGALGGRHLPLRRQMERVVRAAMQGRPGADQVKDITLHYFRDEIRVELHLPITAAADMGTVREMTRDLVTVVSQLPHVVGVELHFVSAAEQGEHVG